MLPQVWADAEAEFVGDLSHGYPTPGALAAELDPRTIATGALDLIDAALVDVAAGRCDRLIVTMPPQEGKSTKISRRFPTWLLHRDPDLRVVVASYEHGVARRWGRAVRNDLAEHPELGLTVRADTSAAHEWQLLGRDGGMYCVGVGGALTGRPVDFLIIDDPVKGPKEAESQTYRDGAWDWWESVGSTRLAPGAPVVLVMCMTGDTPVLMAGGTERALRDIRPGDAVASYEDGRLVASTVLNWANQGPDTIYEIRMKSGVSVRANARHPFLTVEDGTETWQRTDTLRPGSRILRATGANGGESPARWMTATPQRSARACAAPTTTRTAGRRESGHPLSTPSPVAVLVSSTGTELRQRTTPACLPSRMDSARCAANRPPIRTPALTGPGNSASTMTTTLASCVDCSATTATWRSGTDVLRSAWSAPLSTFVVEPDEVVEVVLAGVEDVFDLQVDRTENFIANGLVSHNTRWHEDDLAGRLVREEPDTWRVLNIPAQADHRPEDGETDVLGREPGQYMESARRRTPAQWDKIRTQRGSRVWNALYQGRPSPGEGLIFQRQWWKWYDQPQWIETDGVCHALTFDEIVQSWDMAFKDTDGADFVVGQVWGRRGEHAWLLDQVRGRMSFVDTCMKVRALSARWPQATAKLVEDKANGTAVINQLSSMLPGLIPVQPDGSKVARASAISPFVEAGNVWLPSPEVAPWVDGLVEECAAFPLSAHDDQVDALSQALNRILLSAVRPRVRWM